MPILFALLQTVATPASPPAPPPAPWAAQTRTNPDGSVLSVAAAARSRDGKARLAVRCDRAADPVVSLQFRPTGHVMAAAEDRLVSLAAEGAKPIEANWQFPAGAAVMSEPETVTELTVALDTARAFTVTTTEGGAPLVATFDGPAGTPGIRAVLAACGYTLGTVPEPVKPQPK